MRERDIKAYLEAYGQPQSVMAVRENCAPDEPYDDVRAKLDEMVESGALTLVQDGVHAGGEPTREYAPKRG